MITCDKCESSTSNPIVYDKDGKKVILCQTCFARIKAKDKWDKQVKMYGNYQKLKAPSVRQKGNRATVLTMITRTNSHRFKLDYYENGKKIGYEMFGCYQAAANKKIEEYLNGGELKIKRRNLMTKNTKGMGEYIGTIRKGSQAYKNKLAYVNDYNKKKYKQLTFHASLEKDAEMIEMFDASPNRTELLREMYRLYKEKNL